MAPSNLIITGGFHPHPYVHRSLSLSNISYIFTTMCFSPVCNNTVFCSQVLMRLPDDVILNTQLPWDTTEISILFSKLLQNGGIILLMLNVTY